MCGTSLCPDLPQTKTQFTVAYSHVNDRWYAHVCSESLTHEGEVIEHGLQHRAFGPFDGAAEVLQWVYREASALVRLMASRDNLAQ